LPRRVARNDGSCVAVSMIFLLAIGLFLSRRMADGIRDHLASVTFQGVDASSPVR
jgi:hypothetical protein